VRVSKREIRDAPGAAKRKLKEAPGNVAHNVGERIKTARRNAQEERDIYNRNYKMAKRDAIAAKARRDAKTRVMKGGGGGGFAALGDLGQRAQKVNQYMVGGYPAAPFGIGGQRPREKRRRRKNNQGKKSKNRRRSRRRPPQPRSFLI